MGNSLTTLRREHPSNHYPSDKNILKFAEITYFSPKDVELILYSFLEAWDRHVAAMEELTELNGKKLDRSKIHFKYMETRVPLQFFENLEYNPFLPEMAQVFINEQGFGSPAPEFIAQENSLIGGYTQESTIDPSRGMLFLEYLDLMNVMHPEADFELKAHYAFEIFSRVEGTQNVISLTDSESDKLGYIIERVATKSHHTITPRQIIVISNRLTGQGADGKSRLDGDVRDALKKIIESENADNGISENGIDIETFKKMLSREQNFLSSFSITV